MKNKNYQTVMTISLMVFLAAGMVLMNGCKESEPAASDTSSEKAPEVASATIEQTTCPVMGGKINKNVFTEYKGKKVYFCCPGCDSKFKADPEKYISKLPQFQK